MYSGLNELNHKENEQFEEAIWHSRQQNNKSGESSEGKYICGYCRGIGHNSRSCEFKKGDSGSK